ISAVVVLIVGFSDHDVEVTVSVKVDGCHGRPAVRKDRFTEWVVLPWYFREWPDRIERRILLCLCRRRLEHQRNGAGCHCQLELTFKIPELPQQLPELMKERLSLIGSCIGTPEFCCELLIPA